MTRDLSRELESDLSILAVTQSFGNLTQKSIATTKITFKNNRCRQRRGGETVVHLGNLMWNSFWL